MARAKKLEEKKKLTPEQYWKWRTLISDMWNAESKEKAKSWQYDSMIKQSQIESLKAALFKLNDLAMAAQEKELCAKEYKAYKRELEEGLGISLNGAIIDEVTFEINHNNEGNK